MARRPVAHSRGQLINNRLCGSPLRRLTMTLRIAADQETSPGPRARASRRIRRSDAGSGTALPGIEQAVRVERALDAWNAASSAAENCAHIWLIFSMPTPCSPVIVPPTSMHSFEDVGAERARCARARRAGWHRTGSADAGCRRRHGTRSRSAGRTRCDSASIARSTRASARARNRAVHAVVVGRDAADGGKRGLAPRPEAQALALRPATRGSRSRPLARQHAVDRRDFLGDFFAACRRIRTAGSLRRRADSRACTKCLDRARSRAGPSSRGRRDDAGADDRARPRRRPCRRRRTRRARTCARLRLRQQLDGDFGDDGEQALGAGRSARAGRSPGASSASPPNSTTSPSIVHAAHAAGRCAR